MSKAYKKIRRVQPLIEVRKEYVDQQAALLSAIRTEKNKTMQEMLENQRRYMKGVEEMNHLRASKLRNNLETLESTIDFVKAQWYRLYKRVQEIELKEQAQIVQLNSAQRDLKAIEKLESKYKEELRQDLNKIDQRATDDAALRKYMAR